MIDIFDVLAKTGQLWEGKAFPSLTLRCSLPFLAGFRRQPATPGLAAGNVYPSIYTNDCGAAEMPYSASVLGVSNFCSSPNW